MVSFMRSYNPVSSSSFSSLLYAYDASTSGQTSSKTVNDRTKIGLDEHNTITQKQTVRAGSNQYQLGRYQMMTPTTRTNIDWHKSVNACRYAASKLILLFLVAVAVVV